MQRPLPGSKHDLERTDLSFSRNMPSTTIYVTLHVGRPYHLIHLPSANLPYSRHACLSSSCGKAIVLWLSLPAIVSAATIALITASSVAKTVASKRSSIRRLESIVTEAAFGSPAAPGFAV